MMKSFLSIFKARARRGADRELLDQTERARTMHASGRLDEAAALCAAILNTHALDAEAQYIQANVLKDQGHLRTALEAYDRAIALEPDHAKAFRDRAVLLGQMQRLPEALSSFDRSISLDPSDVTSHCNRGLVLLRLDQHHAALSSFDAAIAVAPDHFPAHFYRGALLQQQRKWTASLDSYHRAIAVHADDTAVHFNIGTVLKELDDCEAALAAFDRSIVLNPTHHRAHGSRADVLQALNRLSAAVAGYDRAIQIDASQPTNHNNRGIALQKLGRLEAARASYDRAVAAKPDYAEAYFNRGTVRAEMDESEEALADYELAMLARPGYADAYINRGGVLNKMGRLRDAAASYQEAIAIDPNLTAAHYNLALTALKAGDFATGWLNYEWRWRAVPTFQERRDFPEPLWLGGEDIAGKTILLYGEAGLGDSIQFCRYVGMVAKRGAHIVLEVPLPLVTLCLQLPGVDEVIPYGNPLPPVDFQCPLLSLPLAFGTTLETVPATIPYLRADAAKIAAWHDKLGSKLKPRIGLTWSGNRTAGANLDRHLRLTTLLPHLPDEFEYVCLQTDVAEADREALAANSIIRRFDDDIVGFSNTAALCACMDLVLTVDTSIAHLCGALGMRTWLLLAFDADWRWLVHRDDSPWYPTMRLYRQQTPGNWNEVLERVGAQLCTAHY